MINEDERRRQEQEAALYVDQALDTPPAPPAAQEWTPEAELGPGFKASDVLGPNEPAPQAAPASAPAPQAAPASAPAPQAESYGEGVARRAAAGLPGLTATIGALMAHKAKAGRPTGDLLQASQGGLKSMSDAQARLDREDAAVAARRRQAGIDASAKELHDLQVGKLKNEARVSAEGQDPKSQKSAAARDAIKAAYPDIAAQIPNFDGMSLEDLSSLSPAVEKAKNDSAAERQARLISARGETTIKVEGAREQGQEKLEDKKQTGRIELEGVKNKGRVELKRTPKGGAGGGSSKPYDPTETLQALDAAYGGKAPPEVVQQVKLAAALKDPTKRSAALQRILAAAPKENRQDQRAKTQEAIAFNKANEGPEKVLEDIQRTRVLLRKYGVDMDNYRGEDIPGQGRLKSMVPTALLSDEGQQMRAQLQGNMATYLLELSGKQASDKERQQIQEIVGTSKGASTEVLIRGLHRLEDIAKAQKARAAAGYQTAHREYEGARPEMAPAAPANAPNPERPAGKLKTAGGATVADTPKNRELLKQRGIAFEEVR